MDHTSHTPLKRGVACGLWCGRRGVGSILSSHENRNLIWNEIERLLGDVAWNATVAGEVENGNTLWSASENWTEVEKFLRRRAISITTMSMSRSAAAPGETWFTSWTAVSDFQVFGCWNAHQLHRYTTRISRSDDPTFRARGEVRNWTSA
jgi:hypothetical protein